MIAADFVPWGCERILKKERWRSKDVLKKIPVVFTNVTNHNFGIVKNISDLRQSLKDHNVNCTIC